MLEPTYTQALAQAWKLVRHHKIVWIFGLLSVLLGQFGVTNFVAHLVYLDTDTFFVHRVARVLVVPGWWQPLVSGWMMWLLIIVVALLILVVFMAVASEGALIALAGDWYKKGKIDSFDKAWHKGVKHFWRLLAVKVVERSLLVLLLGVAGSLLLMLTKETALNMVLSVIIFAVSFLMALFVSSVAIYASGYIVHDENTVAVAFGKARLLFVRHGLVSLELAVVQFMASVGLVAVIIMVGFCLLIPSNLLTIVAGFTGYTSLISFGIYLTMTLFVMMVALLGGIFNAWVTSSWIFLFMKMHREGVVSRVMHWLARRFH